MKSSVPTKLNEAEMIGGKSSSDAFLMKLGSQTDSSASELNSSSTMAGKQKVSGSGSERSVTRFKRGDMLLLLLGEIKDVLVDTEQCLQEAISVCEQHSDSPHQREDSSFESVSLRSSMQSKIQNWNFESFKRESSR